MTIDRLFVAEVKKQLYLRNWTYKDLEAATGVKRSYIKAFMSEKRYNENVKKTIARALNIEI